VVRGNKSSFLFDFIHNISTAADQVCDVLFIATTSKNFILPVEQSPCFVWSLTQTSVKVKVTRNKKRHFWLFWRPACSLCLVKHL